MISPRSRRRLAAAAVALLALATGASLSAALPQHAAASSGVLTLTPNASLLDGQWVRIDLSGFQPQTGVAFRECIANPVNVTTDCTPTYNTSTFTDTNGASHLYLPIYGTGNDALRNANQTPLSCDVTHACVLAAVFTLSDLSNAVYTAIPFAPSTDACPNPGGSAVFGTGAATAYRALFGWQATVCVPPFNLPVVYAVSNGVDGVNNFAVGQQQANFGVTGPLPPSAFILPSTAPSYKIAPITASGLVLAFKMFDHNGAQITNLTLTPYEIAQIFTGQLSDFNTDSGITFLNPGTQFPGYVQPFVRAEHSSETYVFTSWLSATLGNGSWPLGVQTTFTPHGGVLSISGSRGMGNAVAGVNPATAWFSTGNIGFMDSTTAAYYGLPTAKIRMPGGPIVAATPTSIAQGLSHATQNPDGTFTPAYTPADPAAWPMSYPSYMLVPTNQISPANGQVLAGFLKYAVQQGQSNMPQGYVPLPALMVNEAMSAAAAIPVTAPSAPGSSSGAGAAFDLGGSSSLGGAFGVPLSLGSVGGLAGPTAQQMSPKGGNRCSSGTSACAQSSPSANAGSSGGSGIPAILVADSGVRFLFIALVALAISGVVVGPLTYVLARRPDLRRRLEKLRHWRPLGRTTP